MANELIITDKLKKYLEKKSMMEILGVDRDENAHSKFLAWLFEDKKALDLLLRLLKNNEKAKAIVHPESISPITENTKIVATNEDFFIDNEDKKRRADILIKVTPEHESSFYIVIENKIYSDEHDGQTDAYYDHYSNLYNKGTDNQRVTFAFLTLSQELQKTTQIGSESLNENFIPITYQDLMSFVLEKLPSSDLLDDYIHCLGLSYWQEEKAMAYHKCFIEELKVFWKNNRDYIRKYQYKIEDLPRLRIIIKALASMPEENGKQIGDEDWNYIIELNSVINGKDNTPYRINGNKPVGKQELVFKLVCTYVKLHKDVDYNKLKSVFPETWRMKQYSKIGTLTNQIVITRKKYEAYCNKAKNEKDKKKREKNWKSLELVGLPDVFVLNTLWDGKELMRRVIEKAKEIEGFENLKVEEVDDIQNIKDRMELNCK